jgi:hypothetical protein
MAKEQAIEGSYYNQKYGKKSSEQKNPFRNIENELNDY